jgi:hypothetical protein
VSDPDAPATEEEQALAEALREALEDPAVLNDAADLARAVSLAHRPRPLGDADHAAIRGATGGGRPPQRARQAR